MKELTITGAEEAQTTKGRILLAAVELFAENGYARTTTAAIAKRANVSEMTIFRVFGSKKDLFHDIYYRLTPGPEHVSLSGLTNGEDLEHDLETLFYSYLVLHILHMPVYRLSLLLDDVYDEELYQRSFRKIEDMIAQLESYLNLLRLSGTVRGLDYAALAEYMFSVFLLRASQLQNAREEYGYDRAAARALARDYAAFVCGLIKAQ